jgi:predicted ATP-grasp superfamily ATP-dependent carboligase
MVSDNLVGTLSNQYIAVNTGNLDNVIRYQAMPPLNQFQGGFAFSYSRIAKNEDPEAVYFHQNAVYRNFRREDIGQNSQ